MDTRKSAWAEMTLLKVLFCWLILPVIVAIVVARHYNVHVGQMSISVKEGVFSISNHEYAVAGITEINVYQSFFGRIFNYGTVKISLAGNKYVGLEGILAPNEIKAFIESQLNKTADATHMLVN